MGFSGDSYSFQTSYHLNFKWLHISVSGINFENFRKYGRIKCENFRKIREINFEDNAFLITFALKT